MDPTLRTQGNREAEKGRRGPWRLGLCWACRFGQGGSKKSGCAAATFSSTLFASTSSESEACLTPLPRRYC